MAEKRALLGVTLHACRLSDLFTQDMEDTYQGYVEEAKEEKKEEAKEKPAEKPKPKEERTGKPPSYAKEKPAEKLKPEEKKKEKPKPEVDHTDPKQSPFEKQAKPERADTGAELGIDREGKPMKEEEEEDVEVAEVMATDDQKEAITNMLATLTDTYKRPAVDILKKIHERLVEKFGEARAKIPDDLTIGEAKFVMSGLNATIQAEHKKVEQKIPPVEEPPEEF